MKVCDPIDKREVVLRMWSRIFWCCCGFVPFLVICYFNHEFAGAMRFALAAGAALVFYLVTMGYMVDTFKTKQSASVWEIARWGVLAIVPFVILLVVVLVKFLNQASTSN